MYTLEIWTMLNKRIWKQRISWYVFAKLRVFWVSKCEKNRHTPREQVVRPYWKTDPLQTWAWWLYSFPARSWTNLTKTWCKFQSLCKQKMFGCGMYLYKVWFINKEVLIRHQKKYPQTSRLSVSWQLDLWGMSGWLIPEQVGYQPKIVCPWHPLQSWTNNEGIWGHHVSQFKGGIICTVVYFSLSCLLAWHNFFFGFSFASHLCWSKNLMFMASQSTHPCHN